MEPQNNSHRFVLATAGPLILVGLIVLFGLFFTIKYFTANNQKPLSIQPAPQVSQALTGKMKLSLVPSGGPGNTVRLSVTADSDGAPITGFDAVLRYDHNKLELRETEGRLSGYRVIETDKQIDTDKSELIITGIADIDNKNPAVLSDTEIFQIVFSQRTATKLKDNIELIFAPGQITDSNLINTKTEDILGRVEIAL